MPIRNLRATEAEAIAEAGLEASRHVARLRQRGKVGARRPAHWLHGPVRTLPKRVRPSRSRLGSSAGVCTRV
eukprot:775022-Prymnesium_polylepis.1